MSKNAKYTLAIRSFALTLQFYSAKAYSFVRKMFKNLLPHPATLKKWYSVIEGEPGFTHEAFIVIKTKALQSSESIICNIVMDEMAIRKQISFLNGKFYCGVNLGTGLENSDSDNIQEATNSLIFLAVGINGHWKIPVGYLLVHSFSGTERANLLTKCLELIEETGAKCFSITFDGAPYNLSMCKSLGANFDFSSKDFKPWFHNPSYPEKKNEITYVLWDACHMIKLVRNTLGDKKNFRTYKNLKVCMPRIMQVFLLDYCSVKNLNYYKPTSEFCKMFNDAFDIPNCKNRLAKGDYDFPTEEKTILKIKKFVEQFTLYIEGLKFEPSNNYSEGQQILLSQRKTGFLGLIICLSRKKNGISYLLSYKLSQNHLEVFFSALRNRGGFNNNPNAIQFKSAYKRLLVKHQISGSEYGNCSTINTASADAIYNDINLEEDNSVFKKNDHDYDYRVPALEEFVVDIVKYTSGFIVRKIKKKNKNICSVCDSFLIDLNDNNSSILLKLKTKGKLINVSSDVHKVCLASEYILRMNTVNLLSKKNIKLILIVKTMNEVYLDPSLFNSIEMKNHILNQDPFDNHRNQLLRLIIDYYITSGPSRTTNHGGGLDSLICQLNKKNFLAPLEL
ncbi:hypothetical protein AGLY_002096 [Aphis glycines]|uniref:THAP-type domain-containing protein n=1 Tax=Aphis glycines TaxID=307491 RepID=A0A6G0U4J8_APHGL|nr:hypothetical protein AGLY_002096 [Aphis glycines]